MNDKKMLRELNCFYMSVFLLTGILFGLSSMLCKTLSVPFIETALITTMTAQFAPGIAALMTTKRFGSSLRIKVKPHLHIMVLLVPAVSIGAQFLLLSLTNVPTKTSLFFASTPLTILSVLTALFGSIGEEIGWRGYLNDTLRRKLKPSFAAVLTGLLWGLWHFTKIFQQSVAIYLLFTLSVIPLSILMTYANDKAGHSLLPSILLHMMFNLSSMYFLYEQESVEGHVVSTIVLCLLLLVIRLADPAYFRCKDKVLQLEGV